MTACLWRQASDDHWHTGNIAVPSDRDDPDGAEGLLELVLDCPPMAISSSPRSTTRYRWTQQTWQRSLYCGR